MKKEKKLIKNRCISKYIVEDYVGEVIDLDLTTQSDYFVLLQT